MKSTHALCLLASLYGSPAAAAGSPSGMPSPGYLPAVGADFNRAAGDLDDDQDDDLDDLDDLDDILGDGSDDASGGASGLTFKGFVEVLPRRYLRDRGGAKNDEQLLVEGEFELEFGVAKGVNAFVRPRLFVDALESAFRECDPFSTDTGIRENPMCIDQLLGNDADLLAAPTSGRWATIERQR